MIKDFKKNNMKGGQARRCQSSGGQAMLLLVIFFSFVSISLVLGIGTPVVKEFYTAKNLLLSKQSYYLAESGIEDGLYRLKSAMQVDAIETLVLGDSSVTTNLTTISSSQRKLESLSSVYSRDRKLELIVNAGVGASFSYGIQTGNGGFVMANNSGVIGNVYSNGTIVGSPGAYITDSAYSANSSSLTADQENGTGAPLQSITFGNASATQDLAQSFQVNSGTTPINKLQFYIKKNGAPSNCTIRIQNDTAGSPGATSYATGTLNASSVGTSYAWIDVSLTTNPLLNTGTTYWAVLDCSSHASKYYTIGADTGYANGQAKIGTYNTTWGSTTPTGLDAFFNVYLGGINGSIDGVVIGTAGVGNAHAHTVTGSTIAGNLYCQSGSGNNKACNTSLADPVQIDFPITDGNVVGWKAEAEAGGVYSGNYLIDGSAVTLGPIKINGNLTIENNAVVTINGTIWVTGNIILDNNVIINLAPGYGSGSGTIVSDGEVDISNNTVFQGSGATGSFVLLLTTSTSSNSIDLGNNAGAVILYAQYGTINVANNASATEVTGYKLTLGNNATIVYNTGLANVNFISGPGGAWNITKWKEVES